VPAAVVDPHELRGGRRVPSLAGRAGDLAGPQLDAGEHAVDERRLPRPRRTREDGAAPADELREPLDAVAARRRSRHDLVAEPPVQLDERRRRRARREVALVEHEQGRDAARVAGDEEPVDEARRRRRLGVREHEDRTVGVRDEHLVPPSS
jgi:hypothetical protein